MIYDTQHQKQKRIHDMFYKLTTMLFRGVQFSCHCFLAVSQSYESLPNLPIIFVSV